MLNPKAMSSKCAPSGVETLKTLIVIETTLLAKWLKWNFYVNDIKKLGS